MASDRDNVIAAVKARVDSVAEIGTTHAYLRWNQRWTDFLAQFATTIAGQKQLRGWIVTLAPSNPIVGTVDGDGAHFGTTARTYNVQIIGVEGLNDAANTESLLHGLAEAVMDALDNQIDLSATPHVVRYDCGPCSMTAYDVRRFGDVLANYVEIAFPVRVVRDVSYA